ncbi:hypothetical protein [Glaciecola petra]|uniref:Uncharacterized protein n=1 Tax=Glaciecola petra TaxID=3075602 RepID=A0ABU2ZPR5_9ALTE|nr:hypothetical protein [Aestuariibacter sp. P117]MDT0594395.1 hypothetical protein [Aestuariibacter sp. P117]
MKLSLSKGIYLLSFTVIVFLAGYLTGSKRLDHVITAQQQNDPNNIRASTKQKVKNPWQNDQQQLLQQNNPQATEVIPPLSDIDETDPSVQSTSSVLARLGDDTSTLELLDFLVMISNSEEPGDINYFSETIDLLHAKLKADPENVQVLLDQFVSVEADSDAIYFITSLLQSAQLEDTETLFQNLAENLAIDGTSQSNKKLLHLIATTNLAMENNNTNAFIIDIAMFEKEDSSTKLLALDLLQPYQLNQNQKAVIVEDLKSLIIGSTTDNKGMLIENILRFSDSSQKQELANQYLEDTYALATRVSVINSLTEGTLRPNQEMKTLLFSIAQNTQDPLNIHAKHALLFAFDISNDEYKTLQNTVK